MRHRRMKATLPKSTLPKSKCSSSRPRGASSSSFRLMAAAHSCRQYCSCVSPVLAASSRRRASSREVASLPLMSSDLRSAAWPEATALRSRCAASDVPHRSTPAVSRVGRTKRASRTRAAKWISCAWQEASIAADEAQTAPSSPALARCTLSSERVEAISQPSRGQSKMMTAT